METLLKLHRIVEGGLYMYIAGGWLVEENEKGILGIAPIWRRENNLVVAPYSYQSF